MWADSPSVTSAAGAVCQLSLQRSETMNRRCLVVATSICVLLLLASFITASAQSGCTDQYEPNNRVENRTVITSGQYQATICPSGDVDFYRFDLKRGDSIVLTLSNLPADYDIELFSMNTGQRVAVSDNSKTTDEMIRWMTNKDDAMFVKIFGYRNVSSQALYLLGYQRFPALDLDSRTEDPSAELAGIRSGMSEADYINLMEFLQYAKNTSQCISAIAGWKASGVVLATPGTAAACGSMFTEITKVMSKYIQPDPVGGDEGHVVAAHSGKCLDVSGGSRESGASVIQWTCGEQDNQWWSFIPVGDYYKIIARHSGKCLDVSGGSTGNGAQVIQWDCNNSDNQLWRLSREGGGYSRIIAKHSGKCLDVWNGSTDNGVQILQWDCHGDSNQLWSPR
jgi:hypothetical protein